MENNFGWNQTLMLDGPRGSFNMTFTTNIIFLNLYMGWREENERLTLDFIRL